MARPGAAAAPNPHVAATECLVGLRLLLHSRGCGARRDEKVGFTEDERARLRTLEEHTLPSRFGIRPFDGRAFLITFTLLVLAAISAIRLASITGRNPLVWAVIAVLFPPVLLFLLLAAPKSSGESRGAPA